jgi:mediator of RNA polymerase II transcription subunit 18
MHEILLYSQIAPTRHNQVLNVLAGVTGSQPFVYQDQTALFAQLRLPETTVSSKKKPVPGTPRPEKWVHKLTRPVQVTSDPPESVGSWRVRVDQIPDPSVKDHTAREVTESEVRDVKTFEDAEMYRFLGQQYFLGHRFVTGNVIVRIFRVLLTQQQLPADKVLEGPPLPLSELQLLDPSNTYMVEVSVRMEDRKNTKIAEQAIAELLQFQNAVEGVIDLRVPQRLALDTRVKGA